MCTLKENTQFKPFIENIKRQISSSQQKALLAVNKELIVLYWNIGKSILEAQEREGWGAKIIDQLAKEIKFTFPELKGFSTRNLKYMRQFAETYPEFEFVQATLAQIPWYHNITLLEKVKNLDERTWYVLKTIENGWSRNTLVHQIES